MPALRNDRHELFAKALAVGKSASEAYRSAGYQCAPHKARGHGHRLRTREDIAARVDELSTKARGRIAEPEPAAKRPLKRKRPTFPKFQQTRRAGRPPIYEEAFCPRARKLALLGLTDTEIADQFGISPDTLYEWGRRHPQFSEALKAGKSEADAEVAEALFERARGAKVPGVKIFMPPGSPDPVYAPFTEHLPPDTNAAVRWLMNRQPQRWRERKEVEITGSLEHRIAMMTPAQRKARLIELQRKAALVIEHDPGES